MLEMAFLANSNNQIALAHRQRLVACRLCGYVYVKYNQKRSLPSEGFQCLCEVECIAF